MTTATAEVIEMRPKMDVSTALNQLAEAYNNEVKEFDQLFDEVEELRADKEQSRDLLARYKSTIEDKNTLLDDALKTIETLRSHNQKLEVKLSSAEIDAKSSKANAKESKRLKEQNKRLQAKNAELQKAKESHIRDLKEYRESIARLNQVLYQSKITNVYNKDGHLVMVMPYMSGISVSHEKQGQQLTLIYSDGNGIWRQMALDSDGEIGIAKMNFPEGTPERTQNLAMKFICEPTEEVEQMAEAWLRKVNIKQGGKVTAQDLDLSLLQ